MSVITVNGLYGLSVRKAEPRDTYQEIYGMELAYVLEDCPYTSEIRRAVHQGGQAGVLGRGLKLLTPGGVSPLVSLSCALQLS